MSSLISWQLELAVKPGRLESFRALMEEMVESARAEPGTLDYEWTLAPDEESCHIYERYVDSSAGVAHLRMLDERFPGRMDAEADVRRFSVYGPASDELRNALAAFEPVYMAPLGGFAR